MNETLALNSLRDEVKALDLKTGAFFMDKTKFHEFEIGGLTFTGSIGSMGPMITAKKGVIPYGNVPLGPTVKLDVIPEDAKRRKPAMFAIVNQKGEAKIKLDNMSSDDSMTLAREFGIEIAGVQDSLTFRESHAWNALKNWVAENPRTAIAYSKNATYMPNWYRQSLS